MSALCQKLRRTPVPANSRPFAHLVGAGVSYQFTNMPMVNIAKE